MRVLLTGCSGLLGSYLLKTGDMRDLFFTERFDILDETAVRDAFNDFHPELVIHCAGESRVDHAEQNPGDAWRLNVHGTENLLAASYNWKSAFVYISTNAVYEGTEAPYSEIDYCNPINVYGKTKLEAERLTLCYRYQATIIRPIFLYGWVNEGKRKNMDARVRDALNKGEHMKVCTDIFTQPTYAGDCARAIWEIAKKQKSPKEIFNVAARNKMSLFKFASEVAKVFGLDGSLLHQAKMDEFFSYAPRPKDTCFNLNKLTNNGIVLKDAQGGLQAMKEERVSLG